MTVVWHTVHGTRYMAKNSWSLCCYLYCFKDGDTLITILRSWDLKVTLLLEKIRTYCRIVSRPTLLRVLVPVVVSQKFVTVGQYLFVCSPVFFRDFFCLFKYSSCFQSILKKNNTFQSVLVVSCLFWFLFFNHGPLPIVPLPILWYFCQWRLYSFFRWTYNFI